MTKLSNSFVNGIPQCSVPCGVGQRSREVVCLSNQGDVEDDEECNMNLKPDVLQNCDMGACARSWFTSLWSQRVTCQHSIIWVCVCVYMCVYSGENLPRTCVIILSALQSVAGATEPAQLYAWWIMWLISHWATVKGNVHQKWRFVTQVHARTSWSGTQDPGVRYCTHIHACTQRHSSNSTDLMHRCMCLG